MNPRRGSAGWLLAGVALACAASVAYPLLPGRSTPPPADKKDEATGQASRFPTRAAFVAPPERARIAGATSQQQVGRVPDGIQEQRYANGQLQYRGKWHEGHRVGTHRHYHENGQLAGEEQWGGPVRRHGPSVFYYPDGQVMRRGGYTNGMRSGSWVEYWQDGSLRSRGSYLQRRRSDGLLESFEDGYWEFWDIFGNAAPETGFYRLGDKVDR